HAIRPDPAACRILASATRAQAALTEDLAGGVEPGRAHYPAAGVRRGAAQVQAAEWRLVARVAGDRAEGEELAGSHRPLEDVAACEVENALAVEGRQDLHVAVG